MTRAWPLCFILAVAAASPAAAKTPWSLGTQPSIEARPTEPESDAAVRASCFGGLLSLRIGATYDIGKGKGEAVSAQIESGGKSAKIQGVSRNSPDSEMTGGTELVTELPLTSPAVAILFSGKAVTLVTADQKRHPLVDADSAGETKKFLTRCGS